MKKMIIISSNTSSIIKFRIDMLLRFKKIGYEIIAVGDEEKSKWANELSYYDIRYEQIKINRTSKNPINDLKYKKELKQFLAFENPDLVFLYFAKPIIYGLQACHQCKIKNVYVMICGLGSIIRGSGLKNSIIKTIMLYEYRTSLKYAKGILFQNEDDKEFLLSNKIIKKVNNIKIINGSGVSLKYFKKELLPNNPIFLFVGRLIRDKGIMEYLKSAKIIKHVYPDVRFMLVGPFDSNPSSLKQADLDYYIKNNFIDYYGEQKDVRPFLKECSIFVLPSYFEGTPRSVLEAMATGRIIITTNAPGCKNTVIDGENGFLVPVKNVNKLVEKMTILIENFGPYKKLAERSYELAKEKFDVEKVNNEIINFIQGENKNE